MCGCACNCVDVNKHTDMSTAWSGTAVHPPRVTLLLCRGIFGRKTARVVNGDGRGAPGWRTGAVFPGCYQHSPHIMSFEAVVRELLYLSSAGNHSSSDKAAAKVSRPCSAFSCCTGLWNKGRGQEAGNALL